MCGIAGFYGRPNAAVLARALARRMIGAISHRGPDAQGFFVGDEIALGHARLSILDLASGQQPMANADKSVWISFNGEIFNYIELREEMIASGRRFASNSDTEVILQLYDELGPDCVTKLNGDFAFALWDARRRRLMLARDRMGVRPLFYTRQSGALYFASEIKALLEVPGVSAELDPIALEIQWKRLVSMVDEASTAFIRTSFSVLVREANDFAVVHVDPFRSAVDVDRALGDCRYVRALGGRRLSRFAQEVGAHRGGCGQADGGKGYCEKSGGNEFHVILRFNGWVDVTIRSARLNPVRVYSRMDIYPLSARSRALGQT